MPIEIKELHIKAVVASDHESGSNTQSSSDSDQKAIIDACIEKVLKILAAKKER
ncbi:MAG TPA: DUF5908 family protein [Cyclobacteriaceae bacterium]|nr:DUF5908 family protein [Cyclobacteriaceae bacterium]